MNRIAFVFIFVLSLSVIAGEIPPKIFVDKGACPFECCTYRDWKAQKEIKLFNKPNGTISIGVVKSGETVKAVTGEVHVTPTPMEIVFDHGSFKKGEKVYLLTNEGEGYQKVWFNGNVTSEEVTFAYNLVNGDKSCSKPSPECWGRISGKQNSVWWAEIKLENGKTGWTKETDKFENEDACG